MSFVENFTNDLNKSINTTIDIGKKVIDSTIESVGTGLEKSVNSTAKSLDNNGSLINTVDSSVDNFYKTMFNTLIRPFDKTAIMTSKDYNVFRIIGMFIILVIGYISGLLYDNTIGLVFKKLGLDKRNKVSKKKNTKMSVLMKILKTILGVFAGILDIVLLAFTNQNAVLTTIVNDLLKNK